MESNNKKFNIKLIIKVLYPIWNIRLFIVQNYLKDYIFLYDNKLKYTRMNTILDLEEISNELFY